MHDVLLLAGETGSGKSTQVPQMILTEPWCRPQQATLRSNQDHPESGGPNGRVGGCIAVTQPRRVAAISLARRVAEEMGTPLGSSSPASLVGYSVRFDNSTSPSTRIKYLTEGMLLQEMLRDPWLREYSAVIVDEVHERGVNVDLILAFLRRMVRGDHGGRGGVGIKVVVMSATADMGSIGNFFEHGSVSESGPIMDTNTSDPTDGDGETSEPDAERSRFSDITSPNARKASANDAKTDLVRPSDVATCRIEGRQYPVKTIYSPQPVEDILHAALQTIFHIHVHEALPGDILVFLTGQETVENLESLCREYGLSLDPRASPRLLVLPLFAALPQSAQQRVFERTPPRTRKVILATNIAETSVTVPGVRFVVDSGQCKKKQFRSRLGLDSLLVKPISKSAANQRRGRAGREAAGVCYRLYTERAYLSLNPDNDPEILRCDLSHMALTLKARGVDNLSQFPLLTPPPRQALERALWHLLQLRALDPEDGHITELGRQIARLPLAASLGCVLITAADPSHDCIAECVDIISALSVENVFLNATTEEKREEAESAREELYRREGDHMTLLATVQAYAAENSDRRTWCQKRFVSHRAMQAVMDVRKQLATQIQWLCPRETSTAAMGDRNVTDLTCRILKAFIRGFAANTARLMPDGTYQTIMGHQKVAIHPSSVLFGRKVEAILYNEFVFTQRTYARGVSAVQMNWVGEALDAV